MKHLDPNDRPSSDDSGCMCDDPDCDINIPDND